MRTGDFFKSRFLKPLDFPQPKLVVVTHVGTETFRDSVPSPSRSCTSRAYKSR
jgi:hypothetical protein